MNFRVFAAGLVTIIVYQLAVAAAVVFFVVHCERCEKHDCAVDVGTQDPVHAVLAMGFPL